MSTPLKVRIERLEAELDEYRRAFRDLIETRIDIARAVDGSPSREELIAQNARLSEALYWTSQRSSYLTEQNQRHIQHVRGVGSEQKK